MWTVRYIAMVLVVTAIAIIVGAVLWNSEESQALDPNSPIGKGWGIGPEDAPIVLRSFPDFT
ncbi:MAG: hypothetical protein FJZ95_05705 [Chloroflexi bacterium]|nr:hypothetical protein [Chloroflexota bacterium]